MNRMLGVFALTLLVATTTASYPAENALYDDLLAQNLYQRLHSLAEANNYDESSYGRRPDWMKDDIALKLRDQGQAEIRDHEYLEHSSLNDGFPYISGGTGEDQQHLQPTDKQKNKQEVKPDEVLPFYCHPPNPCPKGYQAKDGCHDFIKDEADFQQEWILKMQRKGMCVCDEEHMFQCPSSPSDDVPGKYEQSDVDNVLDRLLNVQTENNPYIDSQSKREFLVAKKSPRI